MLHKVIQGFTGLYGVNNRASNGKENSRLDGNPFFFKGYIGRL